MKVPFLGVQEISSWKEIRVHHGVAPLVIRLQNFIALNYLMMEMEIYMQQCTMTRIYGSLHSTELVGILRN